MEIREIKYFLAVAEEKTITAAAQKLYISQPPLSRAIKSLEDKIGTPLFIRDPAGLELTASGRALEKYARALLLQHSEMMREMKAISSRLNNRIILGANDGTYKFVIPHLVKLVNENIENPEIIIQHLPTDSIFREILDGTIDIGFARTPIPDKEKFDVLEIHKEGWAALVSKKYEWKTQSGGSTTIKQIVSQPLIFPSRQSLYVPIMEELTIDGVLPNVICYYFKLESAVVLADHGLGVAIVPEITAAMINHEDYVLKPISDLKLTTGYCAIKNKEFSTEIVLQLWEMIRRSGCFLAD
ncbi:MAG TPA: LysR family transcriptional regulator [Thermoclostridium sp.]|nr:LysR family transcriptional regulator [Thermoclostridium sp.]